MVKLLCYVITLILFASQGGADSQPNDSHATKHSRSSRDEILISRLASLASLFDQQSQRLSRIEKKLDMFFSKSPKKTPKEHRHHFHGKRESPHKVEHMETTPSNCAEALVKTRENGIYSIKLDAFGPEAFSVYCDATTQGGNWTVIQRRQDGSVDFFRNWADYKEGFGNLDGEFFIGLDKLHALTTDQSQELLIVMEDFENNVRFAKYNAFAIGNEDEAYALKVLGAYSGDAGDSLRNHVLQKFSTKDRDNDIYPGNCAATYKGAWWYERCHLSNLNGLYLKGAYSADKYAQGVVWYSWRQYYYSLKSVQMLIRPKSG